MLGVERQTIGANAPAWVASFHACFYNTVMVSTQSLPVLNVPEQRSTALVRLDVVDLNGCLGEAVSVAHSAQGVLC